ncbi:hypothetical protein I7I50_06528 [Histoplasma capsulatum G186AR]|uniref:Uncharacterized protein n=1 Tax=Ajellomyces capsulatus TaxID=5037 RepID=A0A8H8D3Q3_AJECA|nr:hypothetical protein I7I52_10400 [Histoplasma capsulatum]QSS67442.1 hypothetical protein I7I50_06528 [Histoplasma capsulatum G186AR]
MERAALIKTFPTSEVWETIHLGDYWMDGVSALHSDEHPLWKGYIDVEEITTDHTPPFYRQLTSEQFQALRVILEDSSLKIFPSEAFGRWWPRHFTLNGKAKDTKTAPITAEEALSLEDAKPLVRTFMYRGKPMVNLPKSLLPNSTDVSPILPAAQQKELEEKTAMIAAKDVAIRQLEKTKESLMKKVEDLETSNAEFVSRNTSLKMELSSALQVPLPPEAVNKLHCAIEHIRSVLPVGAAGTNKRPLGETTTVGSKSKRARSTTVTRGASALNILRSMSEIPSHDGAKDPKISNPPTQETLMQEVNREESLPPLAGLEDTPTTVITPTHTMPSPPTPIKANARFDTRPLATTDGEIKEILDTIMQHILHFSGGLTLWRKDDYYDLLKAGAPYPRLLQELDSRGIELNKPCLRKDIASVFKARPTSQLSDQMEKSPASTTAVSEASSSSLTSLGEDSEQFETPEPSYSPGNLLSRLKYPVSQCLQRQLKYTVLLKLEVIEPQPSQKGEPSAVISELKLQEAERLFLSILLEGLQEKVTGLLRIALWFPTILWLAVAVYRWWIGWPRPLWAEPHHHAHGYIYHYERNHLTNGYVGFLLWIT